MAKRHRSRRPASPIEHPAAPVSRRLPRVRDEFKEREERQHAQHLREIAQQQLEWAHERTQIAMDAGHHEEADSYSCTVVMWLDRITEPG